MRPQASSGPSPSSGPTASPEAPDAVGKTARRGLLYISLAKLWFMVAGLLLQLLLPRAFGSAARFGVWTLVLAWVSTLNNVVITATVQSVARFAARGPAAAERAKAVALRLQLVCGGGLAAAFFLGAPLIAAFQHDAELTPLLRIAAGVLLCYSFYAVFVGAANGARDFHKQAGLDAGFSTLRATLVIGAAYALHRPDAAVTAFACAALLITLAAVVVVGPPRAALAAQAPPIGAADLLRFGGSLTVYLLTTNLLMFLDGFFLKSLATAAYRDLPGVLPAVSKDAADALVGVYGAAQTAARLPYQLILAGALVIFPVMSAVAAESEQARRYVAATLRYSLCGSVALALGLGVRPAGTLRLLFPPEYAIGAAALGVLLIGYVAFSLLTLCGTILNGAGHTRATVRIGVATVLVTAAAVYGSLRLGLAQQGVLPLPQPLPGVSGPPRLGLPAAPLLPLCAAGMTVGVLAGLVFSLVELWRRFRVTFAPLSLLRVAVATAAGLTLGQVWPAAGTTGFLGSKVGTLLCSALAVAVYLAVLAVTRELSLAEVLAVRRERPTGPTGPAADAV